MADQKKISALPLAPEVKDGDVFVGVQDGVSKRFASSSLPNGNTRTFANYAALRVYGGAADVAHVTGSGIEGYFARSASAATDNGGTIINDVLGRSWQRLYVDAVNVAWFGAVGDDTADPTDAFNAAAIFLRDIGGGTLTIPPGKFRFSNSASQNFRFYGNIEIVGAGIGCTTLIKDKNNSGASSLIHTNALDPKTDFIGIRDISIIDRWGATDYSEVTNNTLWVQNCAKVNISRVEVKGSGAGSIFVENCDDVSVSFCGVREGKRDGIRVINAVTSRIVNNRLDKILDDSIANHTKNYSTAIGTYSLIAGNIITDSQGICALGNKTTVIQGNTLTRCMVRGIRTGADTSTNEGNTALLSTTIVDNNIIDLFNGLVFGWADLADAIFVDSVNATAKDIVETSVGGVVVKPYDYLYTRGTNAEGVPNAGSYGLTISGNKVERTLKPVAAYSQYGFGQRLTPTGYKDPVITLANMCTNALKTSGIFRDTLISNNTFTGSRVGWYMFSGAGVTFPQIRNMLASGNIFSNIQTYAVVLNGNGIIELSNCIFDMDPFLESSSRNADGSWISSPLVTSVVRQNASIYAVLSGCSFKNMCYPVDNNAAYRFVDSKIYIDPVSDGSGGIIWKGLNPNGNVRIIDASVVIIEDSDPNSATFRSIKNICSRAAAALPTTGVYPAGLFLENLSTTVASRGWKRITTGSAHVLGTDWLAV